MLPGSRYHGFSGLKPNNNIVTKLKQKKVLLNMPFSKTLLIGAILLLVSCKSQQATTTVGISNTIEKKLGQGAFEKNNFNNTYVLGWQDDDSNGTLVVRYGVWEINTGVLIYANTALRGSVQWLDNTSLLVEEVPGTIDDGTKNYKFKIDVTTKVKTPINAEKH